MLEINTELITVTNDRKEKYQSWEASVSYSKYLSMGIGVVELTGYGDCEQEAIDNLNSVFQELIQSIVVNDNVEVEILGTPEIY